MSIATTRSVTIADNGRAGTVLYREGADELAFSWEFGGGDVMAIVQVNDSASWRASASSIANRRAAILEFVAYEVIRQKAPNCRAEIDEAGGYILLRQVAAAESPARTSTAVPAKPQFSMETYRTLRTRLAGIVFVLAALGAGVIWVRDTLLSIDPGKGTPAGSAARTDKHIAMLIQGLEPYVPSLHRDHSKDTYHLSLFLVPLDGSAPTLVPIQGGLSPNSYSLARILGSDGRTLWFNAPETGGVDLKTLALRSEEEVRAARTIPEPRRYGATYDAPKPDYFLGAGMFVGPTSWLGVLSTAEVARDFKANSRLRRVVSADDSKQMRRFYRAVFAPDSSDQHVRIVSIAAAGSDEYFNAAFLRPDDTSQPVRLADPDGALMLFTSAPGLRGTAMLARVDADAKIRWKVDTGLDRFTLSQILPGDGVTGFVGARLPVPDKLSEPLLVIVNNSTGAMAVHSLWR